MLGVIEVVPMTEGVFSREALAVILAEEEPELLGKGEGLNE